MMVPSVSLFGLRDLSVRTKLFSLVVFLVAMSAATGGAGFFFVHRIDTSISDLTGTSAPLVRETTGLVQLMDRLQVSVSEAVDRQDGVTKGGVSQQLKTFEQEFEQATERLRELSGKADLKLDMIGIAEVQAQFMRQTYDKLAAHDSRLNLQASTHQRLQAFETTRKEIDTKLSVLSKQNEQVMSEMEDSVKTLIQSGQASFANINKALEATFNRTYPILRNVAAINTYLMYAQDTVREYILTSDSEKLEVMEKDLQGTLKKASSRLKRIKGRLNSEQEEAVIQTVSAGLDKLSNIALIDDGLFSDHRAYLEANTQFHELSGSLANSTSELKQRLGQIANLADGLNTEAQNVTTSVVKQSMSSISMIVLIGALVALMLGVMLIRSLIRPLLQASQIATRMADGDFTVEVSATSKDEVGTVLSALEGMRNAVSEILLKVQDSAFKLANCAEETSVVTEQTKDNTVQQQSTMEQAATAVGQLLTSVQHITGITSKAADVARQVNTNVEQGHDVLQSTIQSIQNLAGNVSSAAEVIQQLASHADTIGSVLDVIRGIAEQTNLLALNAAIEAARAGEQGRGFAVVADEVRTLAQRTHESTREIEQMIEQLQSGSSRAVAVMVEGRAQAERSVDQAAKAGESFRAISESSSMIRDMNAQVASSTEEQNAVTEEINRTISTIVKGLEQTVAEIQEISKASVNVSQQSAQLQGLVTKFKV